MGFGVMFHEVSEALFRAVPDLTCQIKKAGLPKTGWLAGMPLA